MVLEIAVLNVKSGLEMEFESAFEEAQSISWYNARKASDHLRRKHDYLLGKGLVTSAESFIQFIQGDDARRRGLTRRYVPDQGCCNRIAG